MLWDLSYAELHFTAVYWPDFSIIDLDIAFQEFGSRQRRFGGDVRDEINDDNEQPKNLQ